MKYIIGGIIIYIILAVFTAIRLYKSGDPNRMKVTDKEYDEFCKYMETLEANKKKKKKKRRG